MPGSLLLACLLLTVLLAGCSTRPAPTLAGTAQTADTGARQVTLAPGVLYRAIPTGEDAGVEIVDVDLNHAAARPAIVTSRIQRVHGRVMGQAYTPQEWLRRTHALAAINGGYFGVEDGAGRSQVVGLLVQGGRVRHAAPPIQGQGSAAIRSGPYVRSAFGIRSDGTPLIDWMATHSLTAETYASPLGAAGSAWPAQEAVGCGPTLIHHGTVMVTDRQERLVSPGPAPRAFVAYDGRPGRPRHFVLGVASRMTYPDLADFLRRYFPHYDKSRASDAMCLDGGSSAQLSYRAGNSIKSPRDTGVAVPDAIVVLPR